MNEDAKGLYLLNSIQVIESKVYFLGGLFGYNSDPYKKTIKLFYIPINISSQENTTEEEVRKDE